MKRRALTAWVVRTTAAMLAVAGLVTGASALDLPGIWHTEGRRAQVLIDKCAEDLLENRGESLVVAGSQQPVQVHVLVNAINAKLGNPEFDPHGHAIPAMDGSLPSQARQEPQSLSQLRPGQSAKVSSVSDKDPEMLRYLASQGIRPGVRLTLSEQLPFKGAFQVRIGASTKPALLSHSLAEAISVAVK